MFFIIQHWLHINRLTSLLCKGMLVSEMFELDWWRSLKEPWIQYQNCQVSSVQVILTAFRTNPKECKCVQKEGAITLCVKIDIVSIYVVFHLSLHHSSLKLILVRTYWGNKLQNIITKHTWQAIPIFNAPFYNQCLQYIPLMDKISPPVVK